MGYGLEVAVLGVTVVFVFLTALVLSVLLLGWFFRTFGHLFPEPAIKLGKAPAVSTTAHVAAAVAAIDRHRRRGGA